MIQITYTERFQKHYKDLNDIEKKQFKSKLSLFCQNPLHLRGRDMAFEGLSPSALSICSSKSYCVSARRRNFQLFIILYSLFTLTIPGACQLPSCTDSSGR